MSAKGEDFHILAFRKKLMFKYLCRYVTPCPCQHVFGVNRYPKNLCIMFGLCKNQNAHCLYIVMYNVSHHFFIISVYKKYINRMVKRERIKQGWKIESEPHFPVNILMIWMMDFTMEQCS